MINQTKDQLHELINDGKVQEAIDLFVSIDNHTNHKEALFLAARYNS